MTIKNKILIAFGTRPEAIKVAPLIKELEKSSFVSPVVVITGQHREMLQQVLDVFDITPDYDLDIFKHQQTLEEITSKVLLKLSAVLDEVQPNMVVVQGDTSTAFASALAAYYRQIPVAHMEAGLRTNDIYSPFPEEGNRRLISNITSLHLAPTATSAANLLAENIDPAMITVTGNTVIDALLWAAGNSLAPSQDPFISALEKTDKRIVLVTAHRRESWGEGMHQIGAGLNRLAQSEPDVLFAFAMHKNPAVREIVLPYISELPNVLTGEPPAYADFTKALALSDIVLTDSGGIQEEAPSLGKPVLVMRDSTERPEAILAGAAKLVGSNADNIFNEVTLLLNNDLAYQAMSKAVNPYGDGEAALRTVQEIEHFFGLGPKAVPFTYSADLSELQA